jgi:hypothetical protein
LASDLSLYENGTAGMVVNYEVRSQRIWYDVFTPPGEAGSGGVALGFPELASTQI